MAAELIGYITPRRIPVYHLKTEDPKFRLAIVQADFAPGHTREADNNPQKHADIVSSLMAATVAGETQPDLILFQEVSMLGGVEGINLHRGINLSQDGIQLLFSLARTKKVAIGFGGFFEMEGQYYNSYLVLPKGMSGQLVSCNKFTPINGLLSSGSGYAHLQAFDGFISQCSDVGYTNLLALRGLIANNFSIFVAPASTDSAHSLFELPRYSYSFDFQGPIIVINGMKGNSGYDSGDPTTSHYIQAAQEAVLVADVVV